MKPDEITPEQFLAELREIEKKIPYFDGRRMTGKLDAELVLSELATLRKKIPFLADGEPRPQEENRSRSVGDLPIETEEDFEWAAVREGVEILHADLVASNERRWDALVEKALDAFYAAEEASRDPANAHLIEYVEQMRAAYEKENGRPIPPKRRK